MFFLSQERPTLSDLAVDTLTSVFAVAGAHATACASATCRALFAASDRHTLWRDFTLRDWSPPASSPAPPPAVPPRHWRRLYGRWASGRPAATLVCEAGTSVNALSFAPGGAGRLFSAADDGAVLAWDSHRGARLDSAPLAHGGAAVSALAASPLAPALLASGGADNAAAVFDCRSALSAGPAARIPDAHSGEVFSLAWLGGARSAPLLATGGGDEVVRLWDLRAPGASLSELEGASGTVYSLAYDEGARRLFAAFGRDVCVFDVDAADGGAACDAAWVSTLRAHVGDIYALQLGAECLLSAGDDGSVFEWARLPPRAATGEEGDEWEGGEPVDEEPAPVAKLEMSSWRALAAGEASGAAEIAGLGSRGGEGGHTSVTALAGLGAGPGGFLAGTWEGYVVHATRENRGRIRPFGRALLRQSGGGGAQQDDATQVPVTALAASLEVVAVGGQSGEVRFMRMLTDEEMVGEEGEEERSGGAL